jgi:hypothetical protein
MPKHEAIMLDSLQFAYGRVSAWADNADWHLRNCKPEDEEKWRNERDNYRVVAERCMVGIKASRQAAITS